MTRPTKQISVDMTAASPAPCDTKREARHSASPRKYTSCTSSPPSASVSVNMRCCRLCAMSQVGWRLMVASSAKISRPLPSDGAGTFAARERKVSTSALAFRALSGSWLMSLFRVGRSP